MPRGTKDQPRTAVPRYRAHGGPALLAHGFRPFFLLAGIWAVTGLPLSFAAMFGWVALPSAFDPVAWHVHELLFGYAAAAMAGFLLTAIPNWTGRLPLQGMPLLALAALWFAGRAATAFSSPIGPWAAALADLSFLSVFAAAILREVVAGRNWRNLPPVVAVLLFLLCNALSHAAAAGLVETHGLDSRLAIAVAISLIALIGGRIVPSFTRNCLAKRGEAALPAPFGWLDRAALGLTIPALATWAVAPESHAAAGLMAGASVGNLVRLWRWRGHRTWAEPLVWALHAAYLWVPLGLGLIALSVWWPVLPQSATTHALTLGAIGGMTLAVMSRASLSRAGLSRASRAPHAGVALTGAYLLIAIAVLARVAAPLSGAPELALLSLAALAWIAAFALFLGVCGPALVGRRAIRSGAGPSVPPA